MIGSHPWQRRFGFKIFRCVWTQLVSRFTSYLELLGKFLSI